MSTFDYQTPVQFQRKWILYKLTLVPQSGWPLLRVPLNQGDPSCLFPPWPPGPRQGWAAGSDRFWLCELRGFSTFLNILRAICSGYGYPAQRAANTSSPRSDRFWLLELRVSRTFLDFSRPQLSGHGYPGDAPTVGDWETVGRRGLAGQETLPEPAAANPIGKRMPVNRNFAAGHV